MSSLLQSTYKSAPHLEGMEMDGEFLIMDSASLRVTKLNPMGGRIWTLIGQGAPLATVVERIEAEYDSGGADVRRDVERFVDSLLTAGLIEYAAG
ncbi:MULTISPECIES: PqqD family protein [Paenibacillus]|uniref:PqqD family protein n=1 Tax=Paenibacillus TaxID=44249 RepID=UPI0022B8C9EE|nr:PqqD family protein [Paenibacillus caseinilyticus]MCZ8522139.1 PqqD family protein [Paenibacillus caseinilyticus]